MWICGCAGLPSSERTGPLLDSQASAAWRERLDSINKDLRTQKSVGRLEIDGSRGRFTARAAWATRLPDRLRLDVMGGLLPAASLSCDGQRIYLRQNDTGRIQSRSATNPSLEGLLGLPVSLQDVLQVMAGRMPDLPDEGISLQERGPESETELVFHRRWGAPRARVRVGPDGRELRQVEMLASDGALRWRIVYRDYQNQGGYRLPRTMEISNDVQVCTVRVEKRWTDLTLPDGLFVLGAPEPDH